MAMFLAKVPIYIIMIVGRWASYAFVKYLRQQVLGFTKNINERMLATEHFTTLPYFDPCKSRARHIATTGSSIVNGGGTHTGGYSNTTIKVPRPAFLLFF